MRILLKQLLFLTALALTAPTIFAQSPTETTDAPVLDKIVTPDIKRRVITEDQLDSENWEIGIYGGVFSIEDFGSNSVVGTRFAYHMTEDFTVEFNYGVTEAGETSFETLGGGAQLQNLDNRDYTYYNVSLVYNVFPGEVFLGGNTAFNTTFYILAGAGNTTFRENDYFTATFGGGLRFYLTDSIALHATVKDHIFENDAIEAKITNNLEATLGISMYF